MSGNFRYRSNNRQRNMIILICAVIGLAGLYYSFVLHESTGSTADQWTFYEDEIEITSITWEPTSVKWQDGSDVSGLTLSSSYNADTDVVTVTVHGYLFSANSVNDTIVLSDGSSNSTTSAFSLIVNENDTGLWILIVSAGALLVSVYMFLGRRR